MNPLARQHYETGGFSEVLFLCEKKDIAWNRISEKAPELPRAWFELSQISSKARIDFVLDQWMNKLSFHPKATPAIEAFFSSLEDIEIVVVTRNFVTTVEMVYSLKDNCSFFRGFAPLNEQDIRIFKMEVHPNLPSDYFSFFLLHNGFGKLGDRGILSMDEIQQAQEEVQILLEKQVSLEGRLIRKEMLIPFFENMGSFQCFFSDWYPNSEMGNVFLSGINYTVSDTTNPDEWELECAFATFLDWLWRYLKGMNISK